MTALICAVNSKYIHAALAPWYLLAAVEQLGDASVEAEVVEATVNEAAESVAARLVDKRPDAVLFGCYIWNITFIKKLLPLIKKDLPNTRIVLGGPEVSYNAGTVLREAPLVDYIIAGEGEAPVALLLQALARGTTPMGLPGLCYRQGTDLVVAEPHGALEEPPDPYSPAFFAALRGRIAYLETSRGCPFSCAFCLSGREGRVRYFGLERAKNDILRLAGSGAKTIKLVDRTFNADRARARALFTFIIENYGEAISEGVCFHFEIAGDMLDAETLALLSSAPRGALQFEIGLQSFNEQTLAAVSRKTDTTRLRENIRQLLALGKCHCHIDLIAGLPFEDFVSFKESFNTAWKLRPHMLQLGFLKLLHGAPMRGAPDEFPCRYNETPPYEVTWTPWLSPEDFGHIHLAEIALDKLYNSGRFNGTLEYVIDRSGLPAFDLFYKIGDYMQRSGRDHSTLDTLTALLLQFFAQLPNVEKPALMDRLMCDRLSTNASGRLPEALWFQDPRRKQVLTAINTAEESRPMKGVKRGFALLQAENAAVYVDYTTKDPVTGAYPLHKVPLG